MGLLMQRLVRIIDAPNRAMAGGDENAPADMGRFITNISDLRHETGAYIAVVHHGNEASGGTKPRGLSGVRRLRATGPSSNG